MIAHAYSPGVNLGQLATRIWPGGGAPTAVVSTFGSPAASTVSIGAARIGVPTISGPAMTASPISRPAISPPLPATTVVPAGIATFEANGSDDKDKTWVKATFSRSTGIPPGLRRVRNEGVRQESDIDLALTYISILDERFGRIVDVIKERRDDGSLKINIDEGKDQNASALISFKGRLNRDSEEYGEVITLGRNSTPDTLLHEIMHAIPFSMVRELFTHMDLPATPNVRHDASFFEIKRDILKNSRAHEIFSFGSECLMYDIERERGITHTFNSKMMSDIYGSWRIAGLAGVRTTFPYFMPHKNPGKAS